MTKYCKDEYELMIRDPGSEDKKRIQPYIRYITLEMFDKKMREMGFKNTSAVIDDLMLKWALK